MAYRCYCPHIRLEDGRLAITDPGEIHHIKNVLRLKKGRHITVFDGQGMQFSGTIESVGSQRLDILVDDVHKSEQSRPLIVLACAVPKKGKFELIIEKATELGVDEIIPLVTQRTEVVFKRESLERKMERFEHVAISAAKQCNRPTVPALHAPQTLKEAMGNSRARTMMVIPSLSGERRPLLNVFSLLKPGQGVSFFIGPEGDFTPEEYEAARNNGCLPVTLGETVLRVETAAISVVSAARLYFDQVSGGIRS